jgi:hypothetical protein
MTQRIYDLSDEELAVILAMRNRKPISRLKAIAALVLLSLAFVLCVLMGLCVYQAKDYRDKYGYTLTESVPAPLSLLDYLIKQ